MIRIALVCGVMFGAGPALAQPAGPVLVSATELAGRLKDANVVVLHIADRAATFEQGHIPGARFVRYADFAIPGPGDLGSELPPGRGLPAVRN